MHSLDSKLFTAKFLHKKCVEIIGNSSSARDKTGSTQTTHLILGKKFASPVRMRDVMNRQSQVVVTVLKEE